MHQRKYILIVKKTGKKKSGGYGLANGQDTFLNVDANADSAKLSIFYVNMKSGDLPN